MTTALTQSVDDANLGDLIGQCIRDLRCTVDAGVVGDGDLPRHRHRFGEVGGQAADTRFEFDLLVVDGHHDIEGERALLRVHGDTLVLWPPRALLFAYEPAMT